jgi:hypothetical protein
MIAHPIPISVSQSPVCRPAKLALCESKNNQQEGFFGECEYSQELDKTGDFLHWPNMCASSIGSLENNCGKLNMPILI